MSGEDRERRKKYKITIIKGKIWKCFSSLVNWEIKNTQKF